MLSTEQYFDETKKSYKIKRDLSRRTAQTLPYSIVIATMNRGESLRVTLESVAGQNLLPMELIAVDQSADEKTKLICAAYAQKIRPRGQTVKYIHQPEGNLVKARNRGVQESTGDVICFMDDDVIVYRDYFEKIASYFQDPAVGGGVGQRRCESRTPRDQMGIA